jgi:hypothetical protein
MGCRRTGEKQVFNITLSKGKKHVEDFHCPKCNTTLPRRESGYFHICTGNKPALYYVERKNTCNQCPNNVNNVCLEYKNLHPNKPCQVSVGVRMPIAKCLLNLWQAQGFRCRHCTAYNHGNPESCKYCGVTNDL